jgi:hypothetical protein
MLLVDVSGSELFGSLQQFKNEILTEIVATLAFAALQNNDKTGLILFSDQIELYIPPKKGKSHILRIIRELIEFQPKNRKTDIAKAFEFLNKVTKKRTIAFVLSDFIGSDYQKPLQIAARKHDLTGIRLYDPREESLPNVGLILAKDAESGEVSYLDTTSAAVRKAYERFYRERTDYFETTFRRLGAGVLQCRTDESYTKKLLGYFKYRA